MDFKSFIENNKEIVKKVLFAGGIATGSLFLGFIMYYLRYKKELLSGEDVSKPAELKQIPVDKLEKMVNKIKNAMIHNMVILYDLGHKYDAEEFDIFNDDIEIEPVKKEDDTIKESVDSSEIVKSVEMLSESLKAEEKAAKLITSSPNSSRISKKTETSQDAMRREYQSAVSNPVFVTDKLIDFEVAKIKQCGYEPIEYYEALKKHKNNENIKKNIEILSKFKKCFDGGELMRVDFGEAVSDKYLKIISNIYYLNMRKVQKKIKNEYTNKGYNFKDGEAGKVFNDIYKTFLKETRAEVLKFFNVTHTEMLSSKIILRIYPYYFSPYHPLRIKYEQMNIEVNNVIKKIQLDKIVEELYDDNHPEAKTKPVDVLFLFNF